MGTGAHSLRIKFIAKLLSATFLFCGWSSSLACPAQVAAAGESEAEGFHFPSTDAEQFLDLIITLEGDTGEAQLGWYAKGAPWRDTRKDVHYARLITPGLREAISREEARLVEKNCGGKYIEGDNCSFDTNPITCAQDFPEEGVLFRSEKTGRNEVIIAYRWTDFPQIIGTYRLIRTGGVWKVDGIRCDPTMSFNMP